MHAQMQHHAFRSSVPLQQQQPAGTTRMMNESERDIAILQNEIREAAADGKWQTALDFAIQAKEATVAYYGKVHPAYAAALNNEALARKHLGQLVEALTLYEEALDVYEKVLGKDPHPSTASALSNLGQLHLALANTSKGMDKVGNVDAARSILERALDFRRQLLGGVGSGSSKGTTLAKEHPLIAVSMYQLASAARLQKRFAEAEKLLRDSIAMLRRTLGDMNVATAVALNNYGLLLKDMQEWARAEDAYTEALSIRKTKLGEKHPDTISAMHNLAELKRRAGDEDGALAIQNQILALLDVQPTQLDGSDDGERREVPQDDSDDGVPMTGARRR